MALYIINQLSYKLKTTFLKPILQNQPIFSSPYYFTSLILTLQIKFFKVEKIYYTIQVLVWNFSHGMLSLIILIIFCLTSSVRALNGLGFMVPK